MKIYKWYKHYCCYVAFVYFAFLQLVAGIVIDVAPVALEYKYSNILTFGQFS